MMSAGQHMHRMHELVQQRSIRVALFATLSRIEHVDRARFIHAGPVYPSHVELRPWRLDSMGTFPPRLRNIKRVSYSQRVSAVPV
jgi:hypothetical protein